MVALYKRTAEPEKRALMARDLALRAGEQALPDLFRLFDSETDATARLGIHQALLDVGGKRVARRMATGTDRRKWRNWWVNERVRHPELFEDEEERPATPDR